MKKRKTYEISVIDKTYSKTISDETKFYTSDTALELGFELKETEYNFESAEIVLLNIDDRSITTRPVSKIDNDFVYEIDDDVASHYGEWRGQLMLVEKGEVHVSSPIKFRIENDLYSNKPLEITEVVSWVSLKKYANSLVDELKQAVLSVEGIEDTFNENEIIRQTTFEDGEQSRQTTFEINEIERDATFNANETTRQTQELERKIAEETRQSEFEDNEASRFETFNTNEATRQENEITRQQAESQRQSTFETNESERQTTFETAEQERLSAELTRIENENQRNLTSVEEFAKLQDAIGGRNIIFGSDKVVTNSNSSLTNYDIETSLIKANDDYVITISGELSDGQTGWYLNLLQSIDGVAQATRIVTTTEDDKLDQNTWVKTFKMPIDTDLTGSLRLYSTPVSNGKNAKIEKIKLEKRTHATPYTKAPEDYTTVSKEDYYNHVKLMNDFEEERRETELAGKADKVVIKNIVENGDFSDGLTGWLDYQDRLNIEFIEDFVRLEGVANASRLEYALEVNPDDKVYYSVLTRSVNVVDSSMGIGSSLVIDKPFTHNENWVNESGIYNITNGNLSIIVRAIGNVLDVRHVVAINLTETFGAGNEPTKEEMDELIKFTGYIDGEYALNNKEMLSSLMKGIGEKANKKQEDWITPTLLNGATAKEGFPVGYMKDEMGFVHFRGKLILPAYGTHVFVLPVGYRPASSINFICYVHSNKFGNVSVQSAGRVYPMFPYDANTEYDLSSITFKADN